MPTPQPEPARNQLVSRDRLLGEFDLLTEESFAALCDVTTKTVKNRPRAELPPFIKVGRDRLFPKKGVLDWLAARVVDATTILRAAPKPKAVPDAGRKSKIAKPRAQQGTKPTRRRKADQREQGGESPSRPQRARKPEVTTPSA